MSRIYSLFFSGVSSGSGSSDTASNEDKSESPTPSGAHSTGSSNTVKRRPDTRSSARPRHLKPKKEIYKNSNGESEVRVDTEIDICWLSGNIKPAVCSKCEDTENEPVYQGILEVNTKQPDTQEISGLKVTYGGGDPQNSRDLEM